MAGTVVTTEVTHTVPKKVTFAWTAAAGAADATTTKYYNGTILLVATVPGTAGSQPDDNYGITLKNADGVDMLAGQGASRDETNTEFIASGMGAFTDEQITLGVTSAGGTNTGVVYVWLR
jgi:hypothetical protein